MMSAEETISLIEEGPDLFVWPDKPIVWGRAPVYEVLGRNLKALTLQISSKRTGQVTACKVLHVGHGPNAITQEDIDEEIQNAAKVKSFNHPNIVHVLSVSTGIPWRMTQYEKEANFMQMERCQLDLHSFILKLRKDSNTISVQQYFNILIDILSGLVYLHSKQLIHLNITAASILQKQNGKWALSNSRFSVDKQSDQFNLSSKARMPFETCAPELLRDQALQDSRADVWAFGCVAYCLAAGEYPFGSIGNMFQLPTGFENIAQLARLSRESMPLVERTRVDTSDLINRILVHSLQVEPRNRSKSHELLDLIHGQYELVPKRDASVTVNIRILIRSSSRKRVNLEVERSATIAHVKLLFEDKELVPVDRIQLLFEVKRLEDENTMEYYGIDDGSILEAVLAARWRTYEQEITLPLNVENEVDRLLNAYNRRGDGDDTSFREEFETTTVKFLEQVGFYTWDTYQRSKISRLTRLHAEMYKAPERDV